MRGVRRTKRRNGIEEENKNEGSLNQLPVTRRSAACMYPQFSFNDNEGFTASRTIHHSLSLQPHYDPNTQNYS